MTEYILTGIKGFDKLFDQGIPKKSCILVCGTPGTGKTTLSLQFALEGAKKFKEHATIITFEQTKDAIIDLAISMGYTKKIIDEFITIISYPIEGITSNTIQEIIQIISQKKTKRVIIDSITTIAINIPYQAQQLNELSMKKFIYGFLHEIKKQSNATTIIISQSPTNESYGIDGVAEFICDGIIQCRFESMGGNNSRSIQVRKMRCVKHQEAVYGLQIVKQGVIIHDN
jgi:circadian clock protein KaiC